jgi:hypothetical protein
MPLGRKTGGRQRGTPNRIKDPRRVLALADKIARLIELHMRHSNSMQLRQALKLLGWRVARTHSVLSSDCDSLATHVMPRGVAFPTPIMPTAVAPILARKPIPQQPLPIGSQR